MKRLIIISLSIIMFFFKNSAMSSDQKSFYDLEIESINGKIIKLKDYQNKVILVVNTASYCGFTKQYEDLQDLWDKYKTKGLIVLGVPSDSFNQEKKTNSEVKEFCEVNFDINFPLTTIAEVKGKVIDFKGGVFSMKGEQPKIIEALLKIDERNGVGKRLANEVLKNGGRKYIEESKIK